MRCGGSKWRSLLNIIHFLVTIANTAVIKSNNEYQNTERLSIKKLRINLLQSSTICGSILPSFSSKVYSNWIRKSLHSRMIFLELVRSSSKLVILRMRNILDCLLPSIIALSKVYTCFKNSMSLNDSLSRALFSASCTARVENSMLLRLDISASQILSLLVRCSNSNVSLFLLA